jgi:hypothetical protein
MESVDTSNALQELTGLRGNKTGNMRMTVSSQPGHEGQNCNSQLLKFLFGNNHIFDSLSSPEILIGPYGSTLSS